MADTTTTNYGLTKPEVGASEDTWGTKINTNLDTLDTTVDSIQGKSGAGVLKHTNNTKLATTSTGIDVTGTASLSSTAPYIDLFETDTTDLNSRIVSNSSSLRLQTVADNGSGASNRLLIDHSTGDISFYEDTGTTAKFFWDASAESLGIGTSSPAAKAHIYDAATDAVLYLDSANVNGSHARFLASGSVKHFVGSGGGFGLGDVDDFAIRSFDNLIFATNNSSTERMRIDSSGNVIVGTTNLAPVSNNVQGVSIRSFGELQSSRDGAATLYLNRKTNDGDIVILRKDGGDVGSIGTVSGDIVFGTGDTGLRFYDAGRAIQPRHTNGTAANDVIDLGMSTNRFKDLYLSGAVNLTNSTTTAFTQAGSNMFQLGTNSADPAVFYTSGAERARIDSSGNLLVGTTATDTAAVGFRYRSSLDAISSVADGGISAYFGRRTSDGDIVAFRKDDATVGSIGNYGGLALDVGKGTTAVLRFRDSLNAIYPAAGVAGGTSDGVTSLGISSGRFKDLWVTRTHLANNSTSYWTLDRDDGDGSLTFADTGTERMRIDSAGNLLLGTTSSIGLGDFSILFDGTNANAIVAKTTRAATGSNFAVFQNSSSQVCGNIIQTGSTTVSYNTSSDQRLKENIADADDAGSKIDAIQVRKFDWKVDGSHQDYGMIAQELQAVAPEAVSGDADSEEMMGVDYSKLVPMLIKEIQSLRNRVAQLEE